MSRKPGRTRRIVNVPLKDLQGVVDAQPDGIDATTWLEIRLNLNLERTGNPFNHQTADGTIVTPDPTAEYLLSRMPFDDQMLLLERWASRISPNAPEAVSVDLMYYGFDIYGFDMFGNETK